MKAPYVVGYTGEARCQLDLLLAQQRVRGGERAVDALIEKLDKAFGILLSFPHYGVVSNQERLAKLGYRKLTLHPFVLLYTVNDKKHRIEIQGVFHHRQNYEDEL